MSTPRDGLVLLHKPAEITSFQVLKPVKARLETGKVGHTGTLDRFAEGLVIAVAGGCLRFAPYVTALEKEYRAVVQCGTETATLDPEGDVTATAPLPSWEQLRSAAQQFRGEIMQKPPLYSAIKLSGKRASQHTRSGNVPHLAERRVMIYDLELLRYETRGRLELRVVCGAGTYVRSLARDLAYASGSCAHLIALQRTRIGAFHLREAVVPEAFDPGRDLWHPARFLPQLNGITTLVVSNAVAERLLHGTPLHQPYFAEVRAQVSDDGVFAVCRDDGRFIALVERDEGIWKYRFVKAIDP